MTNGAAGVLVYNNSILTETAAGSSANSHWRNNLMLGENTAPAIFGVTTNTNYSSSDYNGFRPNPGANIAFQWNSPPRGVAAEYGALLTNAAPEGGADRAPRGPSPLETRSYKSLAEYAQATGQDQHSVLVDYDVFVKVPRRD